MQEICIIIPCYNEEKRLKKNEVVDFLANNSGISFCFVNDGSRDNTITILNEMQKQLPEKIFVFDLEKNSGKSEAVRKGILYMAEKKKFSAIGFWDADFSTPLSEISRMSSFLESNRLCQVVVGSRIKRMGADIERTLIRHILGRIFSTISNWILKVPVYDSQCGAKIFNADVTEIVFSEKFKTKWLFDVEILARIRNHFGIEQTLKIVTEFPLLTWKDIKGSKLGVKDYFEVPFDLMKIHLTYNIKNG